MLSDPLKKYFRAFALKAVVIAILTYVLYIMAVQYLPVGYVSAALPWVIAFFLLLTLVLFYYQLKAMVARVSRFVNVFLLATGLKLLVFLAIIVVYAFFNRTDAVSFIVGFFIIYVIFNLFEIIQLLKIQKQLQKDFNKSGEDV